MTKDDQDGAVGGGVRVALAALAALAVSQGIGRFAFTPILPMMQQDTGLSVPEGGWLASANYLGYLVGALWAVRLRLSARGHSRRARGHRAVDAGDGAARRLRALGDPARALIAAMTAAFALGQIVGPLAVAALVRATGGFAAALVFAAALLAVSSLALLKR